MRLKDKITEALKKFTSLKIYFTLEGLFSKPGEEDNPITAFINSGRSQAIFQTTNINSVVQSCYRKIQKNLEKFRTRGSGYSLVELKYIDINIYELDPLKASGKQHHRSFLSENLQRKNVLIDVKTEDEDDIYCFKWSFLAGVIGVDQQCEQSELEQYLPLYDFSMLSFPFDVYAESVTSKFALQRFEEANNASVNIYTIKTEEILEGEEEEEKPQRETIVPIHVSENIREQHADLLLIMDPLLEYDDDVDEDDTSWTDTFRDNKKFKPEGHQHHFVCIRDLGKLLNSQVSKAARHRKHFCQKCLNYFWSAEKLATHKEFCSQQKLQRVKYSIPGEVEEFKSHSKRVRAPFIAYCDFEAMLVKDKGMKHVDTRTGKVRSRERPPPTHAEVVRGWERDEDEPPPPTVRQVRGYEEDWERTLSPPATYEEVRGYTRPENFEQFGEDAFKPEQRFARHQAISYGAKIVSEENVHDYPYHSYVGTDAAQNCIEYFLEKAAYIKENYINIDVGHGWTEKEKAAYRKTQDSCWLCREPFQPEEAKHIEHHHLLGTVRGCAHGTCNRAYCQRKSTWKLPVVLHNMVSISYKNTLLNIFIRVNKLVCSNSQIIV